MALIHSTGQEETTMRDIYSQLKEIMAVEGKGSPVDVHPHPLKTEFAVNYHLPEPQ